ncbi:SsrA-binding protein SmpB [Candidatus Peregrinibacteria bacterium]|nr:SsrA-binding protein SmpB [Candidatus Peregrinibacteria bacterium]
MSGEISVKNKQAFHNYEVLEKYEAGINLTGGEVKSIRAGNVNIKPGYAGVENGEVILKNIHISPYKPAADAQKNYEPERPRKLLLHKKEIELLERSLNTQGTTLIPLGLHQKKGKIKVSLGICRGKKHHDKRQDLKKKAQDLEIKRTLKKYQ